jgi:hypothetical protein
VLRTRITVDSAIAAAIHFFAHCHHPFHGKHTRYPKQ